MNEGEEIWSTMRVYINKTKEKGKKWYTSCPNNQCKRQVQDEDFKCGSCQKSFDKPVARYIMSVEVADCLGTGSLWTSAYDDFANKLFSAVEGRVVFIQIAPPQRPRRCQRSSSPSCVRGASSKSSS